MLRLGLKHSCPSNKKTLVCNNIFVMNWIDECSENISKRTCQIFPWDVQKDESLGVSEMIFLHIFKNFYKTFKV